MCTICERLVKELRLVVGGCRPSHRTIQPLRGPSPPPSARISRGVLGRYRRPPIDVLTTTSTSLRLFLLIDFDQKHTCEVTEAVVCGSVTRFFHIKKNLTYTVLLHLFSCAVFFTILIS